MKQSVLWIGIVAVIVLVGGFLFVNSGQNQNMEEDQAMNQSETQNTMDSESQTQMPEMNIVETAESTGTFTTLLAAAEAAGLVDTLANGGPFTVFAPTDEAFDKLPEGTVEGLLEDEEQLKQILTYHVVEGQVLAEDVVTLTEATTLQGSDVQISVVNSAVRINDATVVTPDVMASNGVIHVIDTVLLPN